MIARAMVEEVRRLLAEGKLSQRRIARQTGISRGTVAAIASGRRPDYDARRRRRDAEALDEPAGPPRRCPGCGGMVLMPCRLCRVRSAMAPSAGGRPRWALRLEEPLGLNLRPEHQSRYQHVRARRAAMAMVEAER